MTVLRKSAMTLFADGTDPKSHRIKIVLAEKGVTADIVNINPKELPRDLLDLNPSGILPTLVDRDLVLYEANIIMEYLDERFPHPPLLPVYPVARAKCRMMIYRIDHDWYPLVSQILNPTSKEKTVAARKQLRTDLLSMVPIFSEMPYFLSEEFSLADCAIAPLLWRLPILGIELPATQAKPIKEYCAKVFKRDSFQASLSEVEREMEVKS